MLFSNCHRQNKHGLEKMNIKNKNRMVLKKSSAGHVFGIIMDNHPK